MNWQPIETAPTDERLVIATDGQMFGVAKRWVYVEPERTGFNWFSIYGWGQDTERANPLAGKSMVYYLALSGWSAWDADTECEDGDYEQRGPKMMCATHWAEIPRRP